ncbi:hypothetical protein C8R46DRAFT_1287213 [Mycena filopes]|nr:hypothetical protein C8R46DRAFT_1287213 [Mycena filopes]
MEPCFDEGPTTREKIVLRGRMKDPIAVVSFHWRAITMSTPRFYSTFSVSLSATVDISEHLQLYLDRSQNCPLNLTIWNQFNAQPDHKILARLLSTSERWSHLQLEMEIQYLPLFDAVRGRLPLLRRLRLPGSTSPMPRTNAFELAPSLTMLDYASKVDVLLLLPLQQSLPIASHFRNLTTLICTQPSEPYEACATHLTTPELEYLQLVGEAYPWSQVHFASFMERSDCGSTLHTLVLDDIFIHGNDLIALLPLVPALRTLSLNDLRPNGITDKVIAALIPTDVLPALETLIVSGSYLFGNAPLLTMLEARTPALRTVTLHLKHREFGAGFCIIYWYAPLALPKREILSHAVLSQSRTAF